MADGTHNGPVADNLFHEGLQFGWSRRLPMLLQTEAAECGLACLAMIASYHGSDIDLASLRQRHAISLRGITLEQLLDIASRFELQARPLRLELNEFRLLKCPCIVHWDLNHFVVLSRVTKTGVIIHDPAVGRRQLSWDTVSKSFTGIAIELTPGAAFKREQARSKLNWKQFIGRVPGLGALLTQVFILALALEVFGLTAPLFNQWLLDQVLPSHDRMLLTLLGIGFLLLLVSQTAFGAMRSWILTTFGVQLHLAWSGRIFAHLLRLPESYFSKRSLGDLVSRFGAVGAIQETLTTRIVEVVLDGLMAVLTLSLMVAYSPLLAALTLSTCLAYFAMRALSYNIFREASLTQLVSAAKQQTLFLESLRSTQAIRLANAGSLHTSRYLNATVDTLNNGLKVQRWSMVFGTVSGLLFGCERIGVLWLGCLAALNGKMTAGMLMAFLAYSDQFAGRAGALINYVFELKMLELQGERLADIVLEAPEPHIESHYLGSPPPPHIEVSDLGSRYADGEPWVLRHVNFAIEPGESVAIVGPSGCGKSTLAKLLASVLDPSEGEVRIGGVPIAMLGKEKYRAMLGVVMQDDSLFSGSIADNISMFAPCADLLLIQESARMASIHADIESMPMGYHTLVGDMGSTLSGGQRQRLLLARALYRKPQILVLDEATSHLDVALEREVNETVRRLQVTRIVIAHRPETIASADRILDLAQFPVGPA
jgi:ATP-binding cassette subfamily B protein RaxB